MKKKVKFKVFKYEKFNINIFIRINMQIKNNFLCGEKISISNINLYFLKIVLDLSLINKKRLKCIYI